MKLFKILLIFLFPLFSISCNSQVNTSPDDPYMASHPKEFADYWYAGKAELNHYELLQERYGEVREGSAILIYVTENFNTEKQVKWEGSSDPKIPVLKLNKISRFTTGIYDYSLMGSIFTPVEFRENPITLKSTFTSQDWCGQSFRQMNLRDGQMRFQTRSYFESEGDYTVDLEATYLEDDVWTRIRLEPQMLPLGKIEMIPSHQFLSLRHKDLRAYSAIATLVLQVNDSKENREFYIYSIKYPELEREVKIRCESRFPYKVLGWEETISNTDKTKASTTRAVLKNTIQEPYWELNSNADSLKRASFLEEK